MHKYSVVIGILLTIFSMGSYAWSDDLTISHIDVKSGGNATVHFTNDSNVPNPNSCSQGKTVSWEGSNPSAENFLSAMLTAQASERKVQIAVHDVCLWSLTGWPSLDAVRIK